MQTDCLERTVYYPERAAYEKIAEDRVAAARDRLAVIAEKADRARWEARQTPGAPLARLLRTLAGTFRYGGQALDGAVRAAAHSDPKDRE
jgi:hypothetical protein